MTLADIRFRSLYSRRRLLSMAAASSLTVVAARIPGVSAGARQSDATTNFLGADTVHDIAITLEEKLYDAMIETFASSGDKEWVIATVSVDGDAYDMAGMRLKGNSSLGGLRGREGLPPVEEAEDGRGDVHVDGGGASADAPEQLPWLIELDKYVDDQSHDGIKDLVVRSNRSETSLNEAVALDLLALAGLASQRAAAARFTFNGSDAALRLVIEHPKGDWMAAHFSADGLLFKAEAGGDWTYRGDDPNDYKDAFDLEAGGTGDDAADMQPLFDFLRFLNESDDETFVSGLPDRFDVDLFATYLAMMDLIDNRDDISGPGNNAYLYVGPDHTRFRIVPWDMNLAFGTFARGGGRIILGGPNDGSPPPDLPAPPEGADVNGNGDGVHSADAGPRSRAGATPGAEQGLDSTGPGHGPSHIRNILVERWNAVDAFTRLVDEARTRLYEDLYASGTASEVLARWVNVLEQQATDMIDAETIATEAATIEEFFTRQP